MPHLPELAQRFEGQNVTVIATLDGKRAPRVDKLVAENGAADVFYTDELGVASDAFNIVGVPTTIIIDDEGRVMYRHVGYTDGLEEQFAQEIEKLLAWRTPA